MSKRLLNNLLNEAVDIMSQNLRAELDLQQTSALFTPYIISSAIYNQLRFTSVRNKKQKDGSTIQTRTAKYEAWKALSPGQKKMIKEKIDSRSKDIMADLYREFKMMNQPGVDISVSGTPERFTVVTLVSDSGALERRIGFKGTEYSIGSFATVRNGYQALLNELWAEIAQLVQLEANVEDQELNNTKSFSDLEHAFGKSVAERQRSAGITELYNSVKRQVKTDTAAKQVFEELGLEVYLQYVSTDKETVVEVYAGSKSKNRRQARKEQMALNIAKASLQSAIKTKLARGNRIPSWTGSDDRITIEKKKIIETFNNSVKLKTKSISTKRNLSNQKTAKKSLKVKTKNTTKKVSFKAKPISKELSVTRSSGPREVSSITLAALINQQLAATVRKNMRLPGLKNVSGRFAKSVRVAGISKTAQGYPSIGYTYMKYPYQTFEPGYKQGSFDRDPRKVIDKSIREIAVDLLIGRFYTRRV